MLWNSNTSKYSYSIPPLDKSIYELNEQEAAAYFRWFVDQVPKRVAYIAVVCAKELHIPLERMDCSPESLLLLWKWFRKRAKTEKYIPLSKGQVGSSNCNAILLPKRQLTLETEYILRDIGMYLGATFQKNCENIGWTYYTKPKRDFFVNHPILQGFVDMSSGKPFPAKFEPIHMARVQAMKLISGTSTDQDLLRIYTIWAAMK